MKKLPILIFLLYSFNLFSQVKDSTKITVFDPFNATETVDIQKDIKYDKNIVKWNIGMICRGAFEMDYERSISDKFTFEFGAGITYRDLFYNLLTELENDFSSENTKYKYGPLLSCGIRFYPQSVLGFDGLYISIPLRYRYYTADKTVTYNNNSSGNYVDYTAVFKNNHEHFEAGFIIGRQTGNDWDLTFDSYIGIGINSVNSTKPIYSDVGNFSIPIQQSETISRPFLLLGVKVGLPF